MTVDTLLLRLAERVDPTARTGQLIRGADAATAITGATNATPIVITSAGHGLSDNDWVYIASVGGNTAANNTLANPYWQITWITANTFSLQNSAGNGAYTSGGTFTPARIGTVRGESFTAQELLTILNEARFLLVKAAVSMGVDLLGSVLLADVTFVTYGSYVGFAKPAGIVKPISLIDTASPPQPIHIRPAHLWGVARNSAASQYETESASQRFAFDEGTRFVHYGGIITNGYAAKLQYYGATDNTLTQILAGTTDEAISDWPLLLELAVDVSKRLGGMANEKLARQLLGGA